MSWGTVAQPVLCLSTVRTALRFWIPQVGKSITLHASYASHASHASHTFTSFTLQGTLCFNSPVLGRHPILAQFGCGRHGRDVMIRLPLR